jgi:hypothetical protein
MTLKTRTVAALVRLYPAAWRREYGQELTGILLARPLGARVVVDVVCNGLRQRARPASAPTLFGLGLMLVLFGGFVWNIAAPPLARHPLTDVLRHSSHTLPVVTVRAMGSDVYFLLLLWCGCWTELRHRGTWQSAGLAAMKLCAIASIPVVLAGVLMMTGLLGVAVVDPGQRSAAIRHSVLTYTYYGNAAHAPGPAEVLAAPLFRLPEAWVWGVLGGLLGRSIRRVRRKPQP